MGRALFNGKLKNSTTYLIWIFLLNYFKKYKENNKENELKKIEKEIRKYDDPELTFHPKLSKNHYIYYG